MDPLSDILSLLKPRRYLFRGLDAAGNWALSFPRHEGIKCYTLVSGQCWLSVEGVEEAVRLSAGDCFLLPRGRPFRLASDLGCEAVGAETVFATAQQGGIAVINGGGACVGIGGHITFNSNNADHLLGMLQPIVHLRGHDENAEMRWHIERMMEEVRDPQPGGFMIVQQLIGVMLVLALRQHLKKEGGAAVGWLYALSDRHMSLAIKAMHDDPSHGWTLQSLALRVGMSRSTFALRFKETVGMTPMGYLTRWRMLLAGDRLLNSGEPVSIIAHTLGYESESAFSTAFKREMGCSPRQYCRGRFSSSPPSCSPGPNASQRELHAAE